MTEQPRYVEAHHHLWDMSQFTPSWLRRDDPGPGSLIRNYSPIRKPYLIQDLLSDFAEANVSKSVHVQTGYDESVDPVDETSWLQGIADAHGFPHGIVAYADLTSESVDHDLQRHLEFANMRGIRTFTTGTDLIERPFSRGLTALEAHSLVYDLAIGWDGMAQARKMAEQHPDLQIILGHAGMPTERSDDYFQNWSRGMKILAGAPNVAVKISGLGLADHNWTTDSIRPWVMEVIEAFGTDRCMFATNWPVDKLFSGYGTLIDSYIDIVRGFSDDERRALFATNAERFYKL